MPKKFNDVLAVLLGVIVIPGLWVGVGAGWLAVPELVLGVTVSIETMIAIYYFRKTPPKDNGTTGGTA